MLPKRFELMDESALQQMCADNWPESQVLDFKMKMPAATPEDRLETAKDIAAFANADGGVIIVGIAQATGGAGAIKPLDDGTFDQEHRRVLTIVEAKIEPRLEGLRFREVKVAGGFVMLIDVPKSYVGPHSHGDKMESRRFVQRVGALTMDMTYSQLRAAFDRSGSLVGKAEQFIDARRKRLEEDRHPKPVALGPISVVHVIPLSGLAGRYALDVPAIASNPHAYRLDNWRSMDSYTNAEGVLSFPAGDLGNGRGFGYCQLFRNAAFELVQYAGRLLRPQDTSLPSTDVAKFFRDSLFKTIEWSKLNGVTGPALVSFSMMNVHQLRLATPQGGPDVRPRTAHLFLTNMWIEAIDQLEDPDTIARPLLDELWQCFGFSTCGEYNAEKQWEPQSF